MKIKVVLNGTKENPYHKMGFTRNPFPQIAKAELMPAMDTLNKLAADPIPDVDYIRRTLKGWSPEFVELCCREFKPGTMVRFEITFPDSEVQR